MNEQTPNAETANAVPTINPNELLAHPFNTAVYGIEVSDDELIRSIRDEGMHNPVIVTAASVNGVEGYYILSGHRRVEAAKIIGCEVPYRILDDQGQTWQEKYILDENIQRVKTMEQKCREWKEVKRIEKLQADARRESGNGEAGSAASRAAVRVEAAATIMRRLEVIVDAADAGEKEARENLNKINKGIENVHHVYRRMMASKEREDTTSTAYYDGVAADLQNHLNFFNVSYSPSSSYPKHGYVFKVRLANREEADAFNEMFASIPQDALDKFKEVYSKVRQTVVAATA